MGSEVLPVVALGMAAHVATASSSLSLPLASSPGATSMLEQQKLASPECISACAAAKEQRATPSAEHKSHSLHRLYSTLHSFVGQH